MLTDATYAQPMIDLNRAFARRVPTFAYEFADRTAPWPAAIPPPTFPTGAYHTAELQYLFAVDNYTGPGTADQKRLSTTMIRYWTTFARTGDPNSHDTPPWLPAAVNVTHAESLTTPIHPVNLARLHHYDFWRTS